MTLRDVRRRLVAVQPTLERAVCAAPCVLLAGHTGRCTASNGKQWKKEAK